MSHNVTFSLDICCLIRNFDSLHLRQLQVTLEIITLFESNTRVKTANWATTIAEAPFHQRTPRFLFGRFPRPSRRRVVLSNCRAQPIAQKKDEQSQALPPPPESWLKAATPRNVEWR